ncbi:hypothetical protein MMC10_003749 [Thelotrema lepadinum]|nr:hypothetical protein [Thelotrema lepadinum]
MPTTAPPASQINPQTAQFVTLVSSDDFEFIVPRPTACVAGAVRKMLDPGSAFAESLTGRCKFENINGVVLEKVAEYLCYNAKNKSVTGVADMEIPPELCLELLMAADYLDGECYFLLSLECDILWGRKGGRRG